MLKTKLIKKTNRSYEDIHYSCTVRFLDDSEPLTITYQKDSKGQWLLEHVCKELNLEERDYFGLRFVDTEKQRHWLDPLKSVHRQLKNVNPTVLCFRVKFYPSDPMKLKEEITRYLVFLQLRRDLHHGRLLCSPADANEMAAFIIQSEVGDYDPQDNAPGYVAQFKMLPKQTQKQEEKIAELHRKFQGQVPSEAEANFLHKACALETYGVDPHPVKDQKGNQMYLGVTHLGIVTFQGNKRTHLFKWPQITKIAFEGKMFIVHVIISEKKHACGFKCATFLACKHLWKCAVEQQYFFTLATSSEAKKATSGGSFFTRGSKFRFSGRCQKEVSTDSANITRDEPVFVRSSSNPHFSRSLSYSRSTSLPNRLKDQTTLNNTSDATLDKNHVSAMGSLLAVSTPLEDHNDNSIPEEPALEIGDSPYRPMSSPTSEELPPFPGSDSLDASVIEPNNRSATLPARLKGPTPSPSDLDMQIQELQRELERCRQSAAGVTGAEVHSDNRRDSGSFNEVPMDSELDSSQESPQYDLPNNIYRKPPERQSSRHSDITPNGGQHTASSIKKPADSGEQEGVTKSKRRAVLRAIVVTMFVTLAVILLIAIFVLESDLQVPVLKNIRLMPEVQNFKHYHYDPMKAAVAQKVGGVFSR